MEQVRGEMLERFERIDRRFAQQDQRLGRVDTRTGEIADRLAVQSSTLSTHLGLLERAGLVTSRRQQRHIFYAARYEGLRALIAFLMEDCCQGRAEICGGLATASPGCGPSACAPAPKSRRALSPARVHASKRK